MFFKRRDFLPGFQHQEAGGTMDRENNLGCEFWVWRCIFDPFLQHFKNIPVPSPRCCTSSERCESQRVAPGRNANSGELHFVLWWLLRADKTFCFLFSVFHSGFVEWGFLSPHSWLSKEGSGGMQSRGMLCTFGKRASAE